MADGRVRRKHRAGSRISGSRPDASSQPQHPSPEHASLHRQAASQTRVGSPRVGSRRHFPRSRRTDQLGRLGRFRRRSRKTRRLSARPAQDDGRLRLQGSLYGHFGHACVHTRINFDLQSKEGIAEVPQIYGRSRRPRRQLRRLHLRRTRRRPGPRRVAPENVRPRTGPGLPRIQIGMGSRMEDESRQADRSLQARRKSSPRRGLLSLGTGNTFQIPRRPRQPRRKPRCAASAWASAAAKKVA